MQPSRQFEYETPDLTDTFNQGNNAEEQCNIRNKRQLLTIIQIVSQIWASYISRWWFGFRLESIFSTAQLPPEMMLGLKELKIDPKISNSLCYSKSVIHSVAKC